MTHKNDFENKIVVYEGVAYVVEKGKTLCKDCPLKRVKGDVLFECLPDFEEAFVLTGQSGTKGSVIPTGAIPWLSIPCLNIKVTRLDK